MIFNKTTGHRVTKIYSVCQIKIVIKNILLNFLKKITFFLICAILRSMNIEVKMAQWLAHWSVNLKSRVRILLLPIIFSICFSKSIFRICGSSAFAEGGELFCQKKLRIFLTNHYVNCRYNRRFAEGSRNM